MAMNKQSLLWGAIVALVIGGALSFSPMLQSPLVVSSNAFKLGYAHLREGIGNGFEEYLAQQQTIETLRAQNRHYEQELLQFHQIAQEYRNILKEHNTTFVNAPKVELVRAFAYVRLGDPYRLWLEMKPIVSNRVYGLLYRGYVAGIVVDQRGHPVALLNGDPKSAYAVKIGDAMAPGVIHGNGSRRLVVDFIPTWIPISVGDEVLTSGLDRIFLDGIKVGKVISITKIQGYQSAVVEPYFYGKNPSYFHVIRQVR